jgi:glutamate racemase
MEQAVNSGPIGIFDSGFGGLTVMKSIVERLPSYDYIYLGDNGRAPYGIRSFETVYQYTLECVQHLFDMGCPLVILACNTASAKALRSIQQHDLPKIAPDRRVLGIIRPTTELIGKLTQTKSVGVLGTKGTIQSQSYPIEIERFFPDVRVYQHACPIWVPLVETGEFEESAADYFIEKHLQLLLEQDADMDPLLLPKIMQYVPENIQVLSQGPIGAESLGDYLHRHPEMEKRCTQNGTRKFYTTDDTQSFDFQGSFFLGSPVKSEHLSI